MSCWDTAVTVNDDFEVGQLISVDGFTVKVHISVLIARFCIGINCYVIYFQAKSDGSFLARQTNSPYELHLNSLMNGSVIHYEGPDSRSLLKTATMPPDTSTLLCLVSSLLLRANLRRLCTFELPG